MFKNAGFKMKRLAVVIFWLIFVVFTGAGIALTLVLNDAMGNNPLFVISGCVLSAGLSFICAFLKGLRMTSIGELVENTSKLNSVNGVKEGDGLTL